MAVHVLAHSRARVAARASAALPPFVLVLTLVPPALDLLRLVQPDQFASTLPYATAMASAAAAAALVLTWLRVPRAAWLAAAAFAACSSLALRLVGAEIAPALSLLSIFALGIGGAFVTAEFNPVDA